MSKNVIRVTKQGEKSQYCDAQGGLTPDLNKAKVYENYSEAVNAGFNATIKYESKGYILTLTEVEA